MHTAKVGIFLEVRIFWMIFPTLKGCSMVMTWFVCLLGIGLGLGWVRVQVRRVVGMLGKELGNALCL